MRKFTLFLTLFFATAMTMVAQITSVDQLSNDKCYTVVSKDTGRGGIYAAPGATMVDMCGVTYNQAQACHSIERNANDPAQQFAFVSYNDQLYLYSVSEKKFIVKNGDVNKLTNEAPIEPVVVNLEAASGGNYFSIKLNNTHYMTASPGWCTNPSRNTCLQSTLTTQSASDGWDDGAWYTITEAADFDATEAIKLIDPTYEPEVPAADYYRLKDVTTGNYLFVAGYNEDHSTGATGSVQVVALNEESGDQKFAIEDAGDGNVYLVSETGYYIVCRQWNVDAWNDGTKSALTLVDAGNGEYYIMNGSNYFKVEEVGGINYPFCDAPYDKAAKWVLEKVGETTEPEAPETFAVTASLFPTPQDPENITEIKGIRVQHNEGAVISEVPTAWTLTNENGDVIETRAEWGLTSFDDVLVLPTTTITEAGTYTLNIPAGSLKTDEGKEVEAATFSWTIKAAEEPGYKHVDGNSGNGSRRLDSFTITDGTNSLSVTDIQADNFSPIFADKTANVLETVAGATISFTEFNWLGQWMHAYGYIDYNNDYTFAQNVNADGTTGGELVTYNYYTPDDNTDPTDSWGYGSNAQTANLDTYYDEDFNESKGLPKFILPADLAAGDYRMRVKIDWNNLDPMCSSDIRAIGGCQCDFIIRVAAAVEPLTVVGVTPNEAVEVLDVITVEYSDEIAGEFDVMGMTQIYVGSKSNGAAYEVNGNVLTIDLFNAITTPGEYALHIPAGLITRVADGSDVTCNGEIVFTVAEPAPEYEYNTGDRNHAERALTTFTITDGTNELVVSDIHKTGRGPIYVDKTDMVLETTAGARIHFTDFNYLGVWMHAYAYIDYNNDYTFGQDANADGTTGGELVTYNCYSTNESDYYDIWGNVASPSNANHETYYDEDFNESKGLPHFFLPADLAAGDYRMRIKVDWSNLDPVQGSKDMVNGGCEVDFIIRVAEAGAVEPLKVENITPEAGSVESLNKIVVTFDNELASVDASKISVNTHITAIEEYVGAWDITSVAGTNSYETVLNVEVVEVNGEKMLKVRGATGEPDYDDSFYMSYDEATGNVTIEYQTINTYMDAYPSYLFLGYSTSNQISYNGSLVGKIVNGNIVFESTTDADSFVLICEYNGQYAFLSYFCELTWTPSAAAATPARVVKFDNKTVELSNIAPVKKAAKADEAANVTVAAEVNGKELVITLDGVVNGNYDVVVAEGAVVAANGATNEEVKVVYNVYREETAVVAVTPAQAVTELDVITVEYNVDIEGEFDVMGMTQIYVGSKSNGAAYEVNGKVLTIDLFNAITTPGEYALHIPAGLIKRVSDGSDITCNGEIVFTVKEAGYEYNTGDRNHGERALTSFTITDGTNSLNVTDIHQTGKGAIFVDKTDNVLETTAGAKIHFTEFNYLGVWMHAYAYIDYNNDYTFGQDANADGTTGGELVTYNCYSTNESDYYDIWGNTASPSNANHETYYDEDFNESKGLPHFFLPADLAAGDYRMRIKVDWNNFDPVQGSKDMVNGGCEVDFIIRVAEEATGIENVEVENDAQVIYDLTGRKVQNANVRGIYIINGKKVLVK